MLNKVTKGKVKRPHLIIVFGVDGVGKTTFASQAPDPIFLGKEQGTDQLDVNRFPEPKTWSEVLQAIDELTTMSHQYKTLVIDSLDWIEPLLFKHICEEDEVKSIELAGGGYGKGYVVAVEKWHEFIDKVNKLRDVKKMHVIMIAHSEIITFNDPDSQMAYERYQMKLHKRANPVLREWVDAVLFANYKTFTKKDGTRTKALGDGARVMYTERRPGYEGKNRYGLPPVMNFDWNDFINAVERGEPESPEAIISRIEGLKINLAPEILAKVVEQVEKSKTNATQLLQIENRLKVIQEEKA